MNGEIKLASLVSNGDGAWMLARSFLNAGSSPLIAFSSQSCRSWVFINRFVCTVYEIIEGIPVVQFWCHWAHRSTFGCRMTAKVHGNCMERFWKTRNFHLRVVRKSDSAYVVELFSDVKRNFTSSTLYLQTRHERPSRWPLNARNALSFNLNFKI